MTPVLVSSALLIGALLFCVVATMVLENWSHLRVRVRLAAPRARRSLPSPPGEPADELLELTEELPIPSVAGVSVAPLPRIADWDVAAMEFPTLDLSRLDLSALDLSAIELLRAEPGPFRPEVLHVIEGRDLADRVVGALFAAYAAARLAEAARAAAWVTAVARPDDEDDPAFTVGANLRGKPAAAARLLRCDRDGRIWVTLNTSVDIGRGLAQRPPGCPTLAGLAALWAATRSALSQVADEDVAHIAAAVTALESEWRGTTAAPEILALLVALTEGVHEGATVRIQVALAALGPASGPSPDGSAGAPAAGIATSTSRVTQNV